MADDSFLADYQPKGGASLINAWDNQYADGPTNCIFGVLLFQDSFQFSQRCINPISCILYPVYLQVSYIIDQTQPNRK